MRKLLAVFVALALSSALFALDVPTEARVANRPPGYCCWAGLETIGRTHKIKALYDLTENRTKDGDAYLQTPRGLVLQPKNFGFDWSIRSKLDDLKVKYKMQDTGGTSRDLLKHADTDGCLVAFKQGAFPGPHAHAVVLTKYGEDKVEFYDSNHKDQMFEATRKWFDHYWTGLVVVVPKDQ